MMLLSLPSPSLRDYVSHYWLSRNNPDVLHSVLPDGAVDLVLKVGAGTCSDSVYGTSTARQDLSLDRGCHYLGVSFKPGQSRHFMRAAALELTDGSEPAQGMLGFDLEDIPERVGGDEVFGRLDVLLARYLQKSPPIRSSVDRVTAGIETSGGTLSLAGAAAIYGRSARQLERDFLVTVGVSVKLFSRIVRFRRASKLISHGGLPLALIAADLGYTDQSHMNREFKRFTDCAPGSFARSDVAFLQDRLCRFLETGLS